MRAGVPRGVLQSSCASGLRFRRASRATSSLAPGSKGTGYFAHSFTGSRSGEVWESNTVVDCVGGSPTGGSIASQPVTHTPATNVAATASRTLTFVASTVPIDISSVALHEGHS